MRTISRLFDSHAEAARVAGDLVTAGIPRVQIAVIGPYNDEVGSLWASRPAPILGAAAGVLAYLIAVAVHGIDPLAAGLLATALVGAFCGGVAGGLLGTFTTFAVKPDDPSVAQGIILVTAHVDDDETDIAQAVLGDCAPTTLIAEAA